MGGPRVLATGALVLLLAAAAIGTPADADLWGHITFGRDIVSSGQIIQADPYSFTSDRPWVNHEWLAEITFAESYRLAGSPGLILLKLFIITAMLVVVGRYLKRLQLPAAAIVVLLVLAFAGTYWRTHTVRPQLFSIVFFAILLITMMRADQGRRLGLVVVPPMFALWVNFHGGWIVGLGILGIWTAVRVVDWRIPMKERLALASAGIAAVAATLLNPYGIHMWSFLYETVGFGRADIEDWLPILSHPVALGVPWLLTLAAAGMAVWKARPRWDYVAVAALMAFASFRVSRLDAFFALVVVLMLAPEIGAVITRLVPSSRSTAEATKTPMPRSQVIGVAAITVAVVAAVMVPAARIIGPYTTCNSIGGPWVPEAEAGRFILLNQLKGRMLTWFDWGQYAIWHFGPDLQVSMDGRRETVYTEGTIQAHRRFYAADDTASSYLRQLNPDYIWLPKRLPVTDMLLKAGWLPIFSGEISVVLARAGTGPFQQVGPFSGGMRCFPGP